MPNYKIGTDDPALAPDKGAGKWCSAPQTLSMLFMKKEIESGLKSGTVEFFWGLDEASKHLQHYFNNTGDDLSVDLISFMKKSKTFVHKYTEEKYKAIDFCKKLKAGEYFITSSSIDSGYFEPDESKDLFYAVGGYIFWGKGKANIKDDKKNKKRKKIHLDFEFHFFDRYNWDSGKSVKITILGKDITVTDQFMGDFHRQCYAHEFNLRGIYKESVNMEL